MKKQLLTGALIIASLGTLCAQSLYDIAPVDNNNGEGDASLPVKWNVGISAGYDSNVAPTIVSGPGADESSALFRAYVGAAWESKSPQTTWAISGRIGGTYYFDAPSVMSSDFYGNGRLTVSVTHRVSERLRFTSKNFLAYEMDPNFNYGITLDRQLDPYFHWLTDNSVGYKWTERLATYTGISYSGVSYDGDASRYDRDTLGLYNQFRYSVSPQTLLTLDYRYSSTNADGEASDSSSHYILAGVEHRFSPNTIGVFKAGVQIRQSDNGSNEGSSPFVEAALRSRINEMLSVRSFLRYGIEEYGTSMGGYYYDGNGTLRVGFSADYIVSSRLTLQAGVNYIYFNYIDASVSTVSDLRQDLYNLYVGFSYKLMDYCALTGSYNFTGSGASGGEQLQRDSRDYDQHRVTLGLDFQF